MRATNEVEKPSSRQPEERSGLPMMPISGPQDNTRFMVCNLFTAGLWKGRLKKKRTKNDKRPTDTGWSSADRAQLRCSSMTARGKKVL